MTLSNMHKLFHYDCTCDYLISNVLFLRRTVIIVVVLIQPVAVRAAGTRLGAATVCALTQRSRKFLLRVCVSGTPVGVARWGGVELRGF